MQGQSSSQEVQNLLKTLPDKVSYPVMVPFGSVAFFPGRLIHTNECVVNIGQHTEGTALHETYDHSKRAWYAQAAM